MKNITTKIAETISASLLILIISSGITNADKSGIIKIPIHNWSSQLVGAKVIGNLLELVGEKVEYVPSDSQDASSDIQDVSSGQPKCPGRTRDQASRTRDQAQAGPGPSNGGGRTLGRVQAPTPLYPGIKYHVRAPPLTPIIFVVFKRRER